MAAQGVGGEAIKPVRPLLSPVAFSVFSFSRLISVSPGYTAQPGDNPDDPDTWPWYRYDSGPYGDTGFPWIQYVKVEGIDPYFSDGEMVIIAVLASLLLSALGNSKAAAKRIHCLSNLRQMGIAAQIYVSDHDNFYPVAYYFAAENGVSYAYAWDLTTIAISGSPPQVIPGILWQGQGAKAVQQCPSYSGSANWTVDTSTGYNYNTSYIGHGQAESLTNSANASAIGHPAATLLFGDGQYSAGANKFMRAPWPNPGDQSFRLRWAGTQGFRHEKRSNAAFADGHAQSMRDCFKDNQNGAANVADGTGFLSADNSLYGSE